MMKPALTLALVGAALLVPGPSRAEDTSDLEGLLDESVVSAASKSAETVSAAPATTTVIGADELRRYGIRSLDEALDYLSLGMLTEHGLSAAQVGARGVLLSGDYGNHVLLLIDGHAENEQWDGAVYIDPGQGIPWELVDHLEVILGPGSVLYGSNAMLGVINVVTKRAKDFSGAHLVIESDVPYSIRAAVAFGKELEFFGHKGEIVAQIEDYHWQGTYKFGPQDYGLDSVTGEPKNFGNSRGVWGGTAHNGLYAEVPAAYVKWTVGDFELDLRGALSKRASPGWGTFDDPNNYEQDRWLSLDARYSWRFGGIAQLGLRLYGDYYDYTQNAPSAAAEDCLDGQINGCTYRLVGIARWVGLEATTTLDFLRNGRLVGLIGLDGRVRSLSSTESYLDASTSQAPGTLSYEHLEAALGAYTQLTARPLSWLNLNAGARLDADERFGTHLSPRVAAVFSPWKGGAIKVLYSEAFRAPTAFERYYSDPMGTIAAPDLRPEIVRSVEGSVEQRLGTHRLLVGGFGSFWQDLVLMDSATPDEIAAAQARGELGEHLPTFALAARIVGPRPVMDTDYPTPPEAPVQAQLRLTISGVLPVVTGLSYRVIGDYNTSDRAPFAVGPVKTPEDPSQVELSPVPRYRVIVGLQYDVL